MELPHPEPGGPSRCHPATTRTHPSGPAPDPWVPCWVLPPMTGPTGDTPGEGRARLQTAPGAPVGAPPQGRQHGGSEALTSQRQCWQGCERGQVHGTCDLPGTNHRKERACSCGNSLLGTCPSPCSPSPQCWPQVSLGPCHIWISPLGLLEAVLHASQEQPVLLKPIYPPCAPDAPGGILCQGLRAATCLRAQA